jgi:hypothetical protein
VYSGRAAEPQDRDELSIIMIPIAAASRTAGIRKPFGQIATNMSRLTVCSCKVLT